MTKETSPVMVTIRCATYNQEGYIRDCLEGFIMQKTNFRFEAIVHDDASTDGTAEIVKEYAKKYPDIIKPILETENQYSKHDGSLGRIMDEHTHGKYIAICEGDDYWTDPLKLQKQVDLMEDHPEYSFCFHSAQELMPNGSLIKRKHPQIIKPYYTMSDLIPIGGTFAATNSILYRWKYIEEGGRPPFWEHASIGDLPMMLFLATKGKIGYINQIMAVHRFQAKGSWTVSHNRSILKKWNHYKNIKRMYDEFDIYTKRHYHNLITQKKKNIFKHTAKSIIGIILHFRWIK